MTRMAWTLLSVCSSSFRNLDTTLEAGSSAEGVPGEVCKRVAGTPLPCPHQDGGVDGEGAEVAEVEVDGGVDGEAWKVNWSGEMPDLACFAYSSKWSARRTGCPEGASDSGKVIAPGAQFIVYPPGPGIVICLGVVSINTPWEHMEDQPHRAGRSSPVGPSTTGPSK